MLLVPSASYRAQAYLEAADALGLEVVVATDKPGVLGARPRSGQLYLPFGHPAAALAIVKAHAARTPLTGVVATDDHGATLAARIAGALGLRANSPEAVERTLNKASFRETLQCAQLHGPAFTTATSTAEAAAAAAQVGFPCVMKPLSLSASQGVIRVDAPSEVAEAARLVFAIASENYGRAHPHRNRILVEAYLPGEEVALEGLLFDGQLKTLAVFDKPGPMAGPYFEETILVQPSRLPARTLRAVIRQVERAAGALGLEQGPVHAELRVDGPKAGPHRARLIEMAPRTIGGRCSGVLSFENAPSLEAAVLQNALGKSPWDIEVSRREATGVLMMPVPRAGRLAGIDGIDAARNVPGVCSVSIDIGPGEPVIPLPRGNRYLGFVFARGREPGAVEGSLRAAEAQLKVSVV